MDAPHSAYCVNADFPAGPPRPFRMDRHYLLYALAGSMTLTYESQRWTLPPARAALVAADTPIEVAITHPLRCCSVLLDAGTHPAPPALLSVFEVTPLLRELLATCRPWDAPDGPRPALAETLFGTLAALAWSLSARTSPAVLPVARSPAIAQALEYTQSRLDAELTQQDVAAAVALTPRTFARRCTAELGMSWGQVQRRMRMIRAAERLTLSDAQVSQIALEVGYASLSGFNAAFLAFYGRTPSAYRAEGR